MILTRQQREALKRVYDRGQLYYRPILNMPTTDKLSGRRPMSYRQFRRMVQPIFCDDAVCVPWCGMWLAIESDGYTHS